MSARPLKVALVHYWITSWRGGERVLEALARRFPDADIYTHVVDPQVLVAVAGACRDTERLGFSYTAADGARTTEVLLLVGAEAVAAAAQQRRGLEGADADEQHGQL